MTDTSTCTVRRCDEPAVIEAIENKGYTHRYCLSHLWQVEETDSVSLIGAEDVAPTPTPTTSMPGRVIQGDIPPVTIPEPLYNEDGFGVGFRLSHPPGVECVFPPPRLQCSCGRTLAERDLLA